jgi:hypothetical protein
MDKGRLNSFEKGKKLFTIHRVYIEDCAERHFLLSLPS